MNEAKPVSTPLGSHFKLSKEQSPKIEEERDHMSKVPYALAIGSLMYAMVCTRPDIAHAVGVVSRFITCTRQYLRSSAICLRSQSCRDFTIIKKEDRVEPFSLAATIFSLSR